MAFATTFKMDYGAFLLSLERRTLRSIILSYNLSVEPVLPDIYGTCAIQSLFFVVLYHLQALTVLHLHP